MRKKILSFILALFMILPCSFAMAGCKKADPDNSSTGGPSIETPGGGTPENETPDNGGSSGGDSGGDSAQNVSTLYDLRVASYDYAEFAGYQYNPTTAQIVWFPDGKTMVIDPILSVDLSICMDFEAFYGEFTNYLKYNSSGKQVIDYLVVTNESKIVLNQTFFDVFEVKNYYRPDMEIVLDYWEPSFEYVVGSGDDMFVYGVSMADIKTINPTHLAGKPREYFEDCDFNGGNTILKYAYNDSYIMSLYHAEQAGTNIVKITSDLDFSSVLNYNGTEYTYSIDFFVPEAIITPVEVALGKIWENHHVVDQYIKSHVYNQSAEFSATVSINYGDFDLLYLDKPTKNVLKSFLTNHNTNKKYDVMLGGYLWDGGSQNNITNAWADVFAEYEYDSNYPLFKLFDKNKIDSNYIIASMFSQDSQRNWFNSGSWTEYVLYNMPYVQEKVLKKSNTIAPYRIKNGDMKIPVVTVQKSGLHTVQVLDDRYFYIDFLKPTVDGVYV